jgi:dimethylhistidine N-methyltransferase
MKSVSPARRYTLLESDPHSERAGFAECVAEGLDAEPKNLPCRFLYDDLGSKLFEQICRLPEYYLTRAERQLLENYADDIVACFDEPVLLAELGSGSSDKTRLLIEAFLRRQERLRYVPIDIARSMLDESAQALLADYRQLEIFAIAGEYQQGLASLRSETREPKLIAGREPKLIAWLGSNIGNFDRASAAGFLAEIRGAMTPRDRLLVGIDLRKDRQTLESAYDDASGVTARFNLNLLARINRELAGSFDLGRFEHEAVWREPEGRVEISLVSRRDQRIAIRALDRVVKFRKGERIHTEDSFKYSFAEIAEVGRAAGLRVAKHWLDAAGAYSLNLLAPVEVAGDSVAD